MAIRGLTVIGSSVGTEQDMEELLEMAIKGDMVPHIEVFELSQLDYAVQELRNARVVGKIVLKIPNQ